MILNKPTWLLGLWLHTNCTQEQQCVDNMFTFALIFILYKHFIRKNAGCAAIVQAHNCLKFSIKYDAARSFRLKICGIFLTITQKYNDFHSLFLPYF